MPGAFSNMSYKYTKSESQN